MDNFNQAKLLRRIEALEKNRGSSLRFGTVTEISAKEGTARVQIHDGENVVTYPLRILQKRSYKDKVQCLPEVGETCACLFAGQGFEEGVILGAVYSPKNKSPNQENQVDYIQYEDGTELWYDKKQHKLIGKVKGSIELDCQKIIKIKCPKTEIEGDVFVEGTITASEDVITPAVSLRNHVHTKVQSGNSLSGVPLGA